MLVATQPIFHNNEIFVPTIMVSFRLNCSIWVQTLLSILKHIKLEHLDILEKELKSITELFYTDLLFTVVFYLEHLVMLVIVTHKLSQVSVLMAENDGTDDTFISVTVMARILDK